MNRWGWLPLVLLLAGCGAQAQAPAGSAGAPGTASGGAEALYKKAQAEGQVAWYSPDADDKIAPVIQAFEKTYPSVKLAHTQKTAAQQLPDIELQQSAHHVAIDVGQASETNVSEAIANHVFATVNWDGLGVPADRILEGGLLRVASTPLAWAYNSQKVAAGDAPKSWGDLLDPRWAGTMDLDGRGGFMATFLASPELGGAAKGLEFAKKLAAQKPLYEASSPPAQAKLIAGEVSLATDVASSALVAKAQGAPIDIAPVSPLDAATAFAFVVNGAPHPAAAQLLAAWLASPAGQKAQDPVSNSLLGNCGDAQQSAVTQAFCARGIRWVQFTDVAQFQQIADYQKQVQQIFGTRVAS